jgi:four helix bundle protein
MIRTVGKSAGIVVHRGAMQDALKARTKALALDVVRFSRLLPASAESRVVVGQLLRSSTSMAANYRATCRARSHREFVAKLGVVIEESDETLFWLELLVDLYPGLRAQVGRLASEANQLTAIFVAARCTARRRVRGSMYKPTV